MSPFGYSPLKRLIGMIIPILIVGFGLIFLRHNPTVLAANHLNAGYRAWKAADYNAVVSECNQALEQQPHNFEALILRSTAYDKIQRSQKALKDATDALLYAKTPDDFGMVYYDRGLDYERLGENAKAADDFTTCLLYTPGNYQALFERADCYRATGRPAEAIADINAYFKRGHMSYYGYYVRGQAYTQQKKWSESVTDFQSELKLKPDDHIGWSALAWSQYICGDLNGATESNKKALGLNPNWKMAQLNLALIYAVQGKGDLAQTEYQDAIKGAKPAELKGALDDIHNELKKTPGSAVLLASQKQLTSAL